MKLILILVQTITYFTFIALAVDTTVNPSISVMNLNASSISITSFIFNSRATFSPWVEHVFGEKSIHFDDDTLRSTLKSTKRPNSKRGNFRELRKYISNATMYDFAHVPQCSIEMLGFSRLKEKPFTYYGRHARPAIGSATLSILGLNWKCFYRGMFENWRTEKYFTEPNFWATFFYCPVATEVDCSDVVNKWMKKKRHEATLVMKLEKTTWRTSFKPSAATRESVVESALSSGFPAAVCTTIPYRSSDAEKGAANAALVSEFIHYYNKLGFKVIVYDRDSSYREAIFGETEYKLSQGIPTAPSPENFVYYGYTIRGLLDPRQRGFTYDNAEADRFTRRRAHFEMQGHDKTLTFTQCRFEAKAVFGIDIVMAVDFDEFIYCAPAGPSLTGQKNYLHSFLAESMYRGVNQLSLQQRITHNTTDNPRSCLVTQAGQGTSIFHCYTPYLYFAGGHSYKSIHLGLHCPLTGYHMACPVETPRFYDCYCDVLYVKPRRRPNPASKKRDCVFLHLTTNVDHFLTPKFQMKQSLIATALREPNELWKVAHDSV